MLLCHVEPFHPDRSVLGLGGSLDAVQQVVVQPVHGPALLGQLALHHGHPPGCVAAQVGLQGLQLLQAVLQALLPLQAQLLDLSCLSQNQDHLHRRACRSCSCS